MEGLRLLIKLWIKWRTYSQAKRRPKVDEFVNRSINRLSTGDLVLAYALVSQWVGWAEARGDRALVRELSERLKALDAEIEARQLELDLER
jgi:hypothetical protein